jgi:putative ABC transport system permease protein
VIGVVANVSPLQAFARAEVWLPIFATASTAFRNEDRGGFMVLFQASTAANLARIREEYQVVMRNYHPQAPGFFGDGEFQVYSQALSKVGLFLQSVMGVQPSYESDERANNYLLLAALGAAMLAFMLLPVINLVNVNVSRILDRTSEIGVRKSFGATSGHLVRQFLAENLVITLVGGALGFLLAKLALALLAASGLLQGETFAFNYRIFALGLLYIAVFGVMSGVYPAWRMSRLDPVRALKGAVA